MPNPGGVYRGCKNCRQRKIKCDQTYPECRKCIKAGKECPGIAKPGDVMFRHQNEWAAEKVAVSLRGRKRPQTMHHSTDLDDTKPNSKNKTGLSVSSSISNNRESILQGFFLNRMMVSIGWLSYLPQIYKSAGSRGPFREFIDATSLFVLANQRKNHVLMGKARLAYGSALELLRTAVSDPVKRLEDEVLFAIGICRIVEKIQGEDENMSAMHLQGLQKLLEFRRTTGQEQSDAVTEMMRSVRAEVPKLLVRDYDQYSFLADGSSALWEDNEDCDCALEMSRLCTEVSQFRFKIAALRKFENSILAEALGLDRKLVVWTAGIFPVAWRRHEPHLPKSKLRYDDEAGIYTDMQIVTFWNQARYAHILLAESIQQIVAQPISRQDDPSIQAVIKQSTDTMNAMADIIICSIPIHLYKLSNAGNMSSNKLNGVVGARGIIWPLEIVLRCSGIRKDYKAQAREVLEKIGTEFGVSQALSALRDYDRSRAISVAGGDLEGVMGEVRGRA